MEYMNYDVAPGGRIIYRKATEFEILGSVHPNHKMIIFFFSTNRELNLKVSAPFEHSCLRFHCSCKTIKTARGLTNKCIEMKFSHMDTISA